MSSGASPTGSSGETRSETMTCGRMMILCTGVLLAAGAGAVSGKDWPEWCGQPSRNMAAKSDQRLPDWADCGSRERCRRGGSAIDEECQVGCQARPSHHRQPRGKRGQSVYWDNVGRWEGGLFLVSRRRDRKATRLLHLSQASSGTIWKIGRSVQPPRLTAIGCTL